MTTRQTIAVGRQRFRVGPWQADEGIAHLGIAPHGPRVTADEVRTCVEQLLAAGYHSVLTSALDTSEATTFLEVGFEEHDRLRVLTHDLSGLDSLPLRPAGVRLRRGRRADRPTALDIDRRAFPSFWRLDATGLAEAESATPTSRFRVAVDDGSIVGYAVTGRGGQQGFLQRLATDPDRWRRGVGSALVVDGLRWCERRHCQQVFVNTQVDNAPALELYHRLGFRRTPNDLVVLLWSRTAAG